MYGIFNPKFQKQVNTFRSFMVLTLFGSLLTLARCGDPVGRTTEKSPVTEAISASRAMADSNPVKSEAFAREAAALSLKSGDSAHYCEAMILVASASLKQKKSDEARQSLDIALLLSREGKFHDLLFKSYYLAGMMEARKRNLKPALAYFDSAFGLVDKLPWGGDGDKKRYEILASVMSGIGTISLNLGQIRPAITKFTRLIEVKHPEEMKMYAMGHVAELYRTLGSTDTARFYIDQSIILAKQQGMNSYLIKQMGLKANLFFIIGKYDSCLYYNHLAEGMAVSRNELKDLPYIYNNLASCYQKVSKTSMALVYFTKSLKLKEKDHDTAGMAVTLSNLGIIFENWGNLDKAVMHFRTALSFNTAIKDRSGIAKNYINLGELCLMEGKFDSAVVFFSKALEIRKDLSDNYGCIIAMDGLGRAFRAQGPSQAGKAMVFFSEAGKLAEKIHAGYWVASLYYETGELYRQRGDFVQASERVIKSLDFARKEKLDDIILSATRSLLEINAQKGKQIQLLSLFNDYTSVYDSIRKREKDALTADMLVKYETEKKEKENQLLKKELDFQQLRVRTKTIEMIGLLFIIAVLIIFAFIIYRMYHKKAMAYNIIVRQNLEAVKKERESGIGIRPVQDNNPRKTSSRQDNEKELFERLSGYMATEKPYLDPDLSVDDLCKKLNTNRTYLSHIINEVCEKNFNTFINEYRVAEARRILADVKGSRYSVEDIGKISGFGTKSSFYHSFKNIIGVTPAYFRDYVSKKAD
jgi:tetratricopeptide (TPR) repeat protein